MFKKILFFIMFFYASTATADGLWKTYDDFKDNLASPKGINFGLDNTFTYQQTFSNGNKYLTRSFITPYLNIDLFDNIYGKGRFNFLLNIVRFNKQTSTELSSKIGVANQINSYDVDYNEMSDFYYSHSFNGKYDWLSLGVGQFSIAMFDNITASDLQTQYFLNNALSQDGTFTYPSAGVGGYASADIYDNLSLTLGAIDASNTSADGIHVKNLDKNEALPFGALSYTPKWYNSYQGAYSLLVYKKPSVKKAPAKSLGWSLYLAQDISKCTSLFMRFNNSSGDYAALDYSYSVGILFNSPFKRRPHDQLAVAYSFNKVNTAATTQPIYHAYEKSIETYYNFQLNTHISIRPDVQLYINPAFNKKSGYSGVASLSLYVGL